jgi:hypothetical protein
MIQYTDEIAVIKEKKRKMRRQMGHSEENVLIFTNECLITNHVIG